MNKIKIIKRFLILLHKIENFSEAPHNGQIDKPKVITNKHLIMLYIIILKIHSTLFS